MKLKDRMAIAAYREKAAYIENVYPAIMKTPVTQRLIEKKLTGLIKQEAQRRLMENVSGYSGEVVDYRVQDEGGLGEPIPVDGRLQDP